MQVTINVPEQVAAEARARGISVEVYVEQVLALSTTAPSSEPQLKEIGAAIDRLAELRQKTRLGGLKTKHLIHEGHKY